MGNSLAWGASIVSEKQIEENEKLRVERFRDAKSKLRASEKDVDDKRRSIVAMSLESLRSALQAEEVSAAEAVDAYMWKALQVNEKINCITECIVDAFDRAAQLDDLWRGKPNKPPLFGVPFSVKGNFHLKGYDCCLGLGKFLFQPRERECTLVTHLRALGAIPFVVTNVPQGLLSFVCSNSVYGTTGNPYDPTRTPGGSSGGEAALQAAGGSPFGTGSDLAGSLRIPASMCGVVSIKPTEARLVVHNVSGGEGKGRMALSYGVFTKSVDEQLILLREILGSPSYRALAPRCAPVPLDLDRVTVTAERKLRIGYLLDDGFLRPVPACARVVKETAMKLKAAGYEVIEFQVPKPELGASLFFKNLFPDGGVHLRSLYAHDVVSPYIKPVVMLLSIPNVVKSMATVAVRGYSPQLAIMSGAYMGSLADVYPTYSATEEYVNEFVNEFKAQSLDAIVCPAFPVPAVPHEYPSLLGACAFSTGLYNMLDFPAGIVPTGRVTEKDDAQLDDDTVFPIGYNYVLKTMRQAAANSKGLPLGVQVVTLPFQDEDCLAVMKIVEGLWKNVT